MALDETTRKRLREKSKSDRSSRFIGEWQVDFDWVDMQQARMAHRRRIVGIICILILLIVVYAIFVLGWSISLPDELS